MPAESGLLIRVGSHRWRRVAFFASVVRPDDYPHRCPLCRRVVRVTEFVVNQRSAHEQTRRCYGPIEHMYHLDCWESNGRLIPLPPLGRDKDIWLKYGVAGDVYPWEGVW